MEDEETNSILECLKEGVVDTKYLMDRLTKMRGKPITTEYILTTNMAAALIKSDYETEIEYLNRDICRHAQWGARPESASDFGSMRTDIVAFDRTGRFPRAIIEVKIRVLNLAAIRYDLEKIQSTIDRVKICYHNRTKGYVVVQVATPDKHKLKTKNELENWARSSRDRIEQQLADYEKINQKFGFRIIDLQPNMSFGIMEESYEAIHTEDGCEAGPIEPAYAVHYYAVIVESKARLKDFSYEGIRAAGPDDKTRKLFPIPRRERQLANSDLQSDHQNFKTADGPSRTGATSISSIRAK